MPEERNSRAMRRAVTGVTHDRHGLVDRNRRMIAKRSPCCGIAELGLDPRAFPEGDGDLKKNVKQNFRRGFSCREKSLH
jgi:hypothetical protein